ncbi:MAG: D-2-hydroxyacid dehydrogenase [Lentisphaerae bacterium]|nr:D-2-hydroxyacid dehydrogenase [Lentisphaerota bacterium]
MPSPTPLRIFVDFAIPPDALALLRAGTPDHELIFPRAPAASVLAQAARDPQFATADVAFGQPDPQAVAEAARLRWIHVSTSGITRYDNPAFRALVSGRGIPVTNSAGVYHEACALHALSFMLAQARHLPEALRARVAGGTPAWHALRAACTPLRGQTVVIVGYGAIGTRLADLLRPFDMQILACRRQARGDESVPVITEAQLAETLATRADHIVNILPDSAATRHFFNRARFAGIKPGAIFYNIGRGTTVDQDALLEALRAERLGAAWLDVTEPEPLPDDHPLWREPHCHITPHVAGGHTHEARTLVRHFLANLERFTQGAPLLDRVM